MPEKLNAVDSFSVFAILEFCQVPGRKGTSSTIETVVQWVGRRDNRVGVAPGGDAISQIYLRGRREQSAEQQNARHGDADSAYSLNATIQGKYH